jgi:hypothetical protein
VLDLLLRKDLDRHTSHAQDPHLHGLDHLPLNDLDLPQYELDPRLRTGEMILSDHRPENDLLRHGVQDHLPYNWPIEIGKGIPPGRHLVTVRLSGLLLDHHHVVQLVLERQPGQVVEEISQLQFTLLVVLYQSQPTTVQKIAAL